MKTIPALFITILVFVSCQQKTQEAPNGSYYGILPCADCPGINYVITFKNDSIYSEKQIYQERSVEPLTQDGTFSISEKGIITLTDKDETVGMKKFKLKNDTLQMLDKSGKPIKGSLSNRFLLSKKKPENFSMKALKNNKAVGFKATGNEPFWFFEINFATKQMKFKPMEGDSLITPLPPASKPQDINAVSYNAKTKKGNLKALIIKEQCIDGMSGKEAGYKVKLEIQIDDEDLKTYSGCGEFKGDYQLHNRWVLKSLNGEEVDSKIKVPNLEFNLVKNELYGFGGCNSLSGTIKMKNDSIKINPIISTKMACPNLNTEQDFLNALSEKTVHFSISEEKLTLKSKSDTLIFKNVE